eukprot:1879079-Rhodomonas_salina.3
MEEGEDGALEGEEKAEGAEEGGDRDALRNRTARRFDVFYARAAAFHQRIRAPPNGSHLQETASVTRTYAPLHT